MGDSPGFNSCSSLPLLTGTTLFPFNCHVRSIQPTVWCFHFSFHQWHEGSYIAEQSPSSLESLTCSVMRALLHWVLKILIISPRSLKWEAKFPYCRCNCERCYPTSVPLSLILCMGCGKKNSSVCWWHFQILHHMIKITPQTHGYYLPAGIIIVSLIGYSTNL